MEELTIQTNSSLSETFTDRQTVPLPPFQRVQFSPSLPSSICDTGNVGRASLASWVHTYNRTLIYLHNAPTNTATERQVKESKNKCICVTCVIKSVFLSPSLVLIFPLPSFWKLEGGGSVGDGDGGFHLNKQPLHRLWETAWLREWKERERERMEEEHVRGVFRAPDNAILSRNSGELSANGSSRMGRRMEGFHDYP